MNMWQRMLVVAITLVAIGVMVKKQTKTVTREEQADIIRHVIAYDPVDFDVVINKVYYPAKSQTAFWEQTAMVMGREDPIALRDEFYKGLKVQKEKPTTAPTTQP